MLTLIAIAAGWQVVRMVPIRGYIHEAVAASVAIGFTLAPWTYFLLALTLGWNIAMYLGTSLLVVGVIVCQLKLKSLWRFDPRPTSGRAGLITLIGALIVTAILSLIMVRAYDFGPQGPWYSNSYVWGDSPLHVNYITHFASGERLDMVSPVYKRSAQTYPFMSDLWSGVLMRTTSSWLAGLLWPSLVMLWALLALIYSFARRLLNSRFGGWLAWFMLVLSGSFQTFILLVELTATHRLSQFTATAQNSYMAATGDSYLNFFESHIFPQRSYEFGLPLFLVISMVLLALYRERNKESGSKLRGRVYIMLGFLIGLMPFVHTHSFLVMAGTLALATAGILVKERRLPRGWRWMLVTAAVAAAPQLVWQFAGSYHSGFSHWIFGWVVINYVAVRGNWIVFWLAQVGWLFVMIVFGWYSLKRARAASEVWLVYIAGVAIFAACNVYVFQPSIWDNMKFFMYSFFFIMLASAAVFVYWFQFPFGKFVTGLLMISLCTVGAYTVYVLEPIQNYQLLSADEVSLGHQLAKSLPQNAYILTDDTSNSPVTMLADRNVLMTFSGWINLYGGDWATTLLDRTIMLNGGPNTVSLIHHYGLNFAAFSDADVQNGQANLAYYRAHFALFTHKAGWWVFNLTRPAQ